MTRSLETVDREGNVLPLKERVRATKDAGIVPSVEGSASGEWLPIQETRLCNRSRLTIERLAGQSGDAARYAGFSRSERSRVPMLIAAVLIAAFVLGTMSNYLGRDGVINLLAIPIFGLIAWNFVMYVLMLVTPLLSKNGHGGGVVTEKVGQWMKRGLESRAAVLGSPFRASAQKFIGEWAELCAPAQWRILRMVAHSSAILLAAGVLAGMYLRGLGYEYKAGWESTFLDAEGVSRWLRVLLGPGSAITGIGIPPGDTTIAQLDLAKGAGEKADQWIHLFAANTALYIFLPRILFIVWEYVGLGRWRSDLGRAPIFSRYHAKLAKDIGGGDQLVRVLPFHCSPAPRHRDTVRGLIHQLWGGAAHVDFSEPAAYGEEDELLEGMGVLPGYVVLLMSLSATPEGEAHGFLIRELQTRMRASGEETHLLVLLDENRFRERFGDMPEFTRRLEERRSAWDELTKPFGIQIGYFNSDDSATAEQLARSGDQLVWSSSGSDA
ncbi:MAG: DUF2868 domain-containing protein [Verrucomicrobiae bacterium]|nr:DUF2868 domain-containing protein [Verrucomicrobiae bacterium]